MQESLVSYFLREIGDARSSEVLVLHLNQSVSVNGLLVTYRHRCAHVLEERFPFLAVVLTLVLDMHQLVCVLHVYGGRGARWS